MNRQNNYSGNTGQQDYWGGNSNKYRQQAQPYPQQQYGQQQQQYGQQQQQQQPYQQYQYNNIQQSNSYQLPLNRSNQSSHSSLPPIQNSQQFKQNQQQPQSYNTYQHIQSSYNNRLTYENYDKIQHPPQKITQQEQLQTLKKVANFNTSSRSESQDSRKSSEKDEKEHSESEEEKQSEQNSDSDEKSSQSRRSSRTSSSEKSSSKTSENSDNEEDEEQQKSAQSSPRKLEKQSSESEQESEEDSPPPVKKHSKKKKGKKNNAQKRQDSPKQLENESVVIGEYLSKSGFIFKSEEQITKVREEIQTVNTFLNSFEKELDEQFPFLRNSQIRFVSKQQQEEDQEQKSFNQQQQQQQQHQLQYPQQSQRGQYQQIKNNIENIIQNHRQQMIQNNSHAQNIVDFDQNNEQHNAQMNYSSNVLTTSQNQLTSSQNQLYYSQNQVAPFQQPQTQEIQVQEIDQISSGQRIHDQFEYVQKQQQQIPQRDNSKTSFRQTNQFIEQNDIGEDSYDQPSSSQKNKASRQMINMNDNSSLANIANDNLQNPSQKLLKKNLQELKNNGSFTIKKVNEKPPTSSGNRTNQSGFNKSQIKDQQNLDESDHSKRDGNEIDPNSKSIQKSLKSQKLNNNYVADPNDQYNFSFKNNEDRFLRKKN